MIEILINNETLEGGPDGIQYVKQVNDLADVRTVNSSYSYSLDFPKTEKNTKTLKGLGLIGSTSKIPYQKNPTQIIDNGDMIVSDGRATVKNTDDKYKLIVQDGIVDFFRTIENKSIGNDLDLSELSHAKNDVNIVASFTNPNYRYLISEYNGWTVKDNVINPDYQVPSINNLYIFNKIMDYAGYTYEGLPDISTDWTTFPTPPDIPTDEETIRFIGSYSGVENISSDDNWREIYQPQWETITFYDTDFLQLQNNWGLKVIQTGNYRAEYNVSGNILYGIYEGNVLYRFTVPIKMGLYRNNTLVSFVKNSGFQTTDFPASAANIIKFYPVPASRQDAIDYGIDDDRFLDALDSGNYAVLKITVGVFSATLKTMGVEIFDFGEAFKDFGMTEFVKEIMFRKSLTPYPDTEAKHIKFQTLTQRLNTDDAIDWSDKYIKRTNESYDFGSYAKMNSLLMKHDNNEDTFGNGYLTVNNENLKDDITLLQSRYFAPSGNLRKIRSLTGFFHEIKFWEREAKENTGSGPIEIEYKPISNRFFILREEIVNRSITIGEITVVGYPKASIQGTVMEDVVSEYYKDWGKLFNNLKIHEIELLLNRISNVRMDKPFYFSQEGAFYVLNKLIYKSGQKAKGEFIKIDY